MKRQFKNKVENILKGEVISHTHPVPITAITNAVQTYLIQNPPSGGITLQQVKSDSEIASVISLRHSNTSDHAPGSDNQDLSGFVTTNDSRLTDAREPLPHTHTSGSGDGFMINVQALTSSPVDSQTVYFGMLPKAPTTTANISKIYIRKSCTLKVAEIYCYSGTAGTGEAWSLYVRKNNSSDSLIATVSLNTNQRVFSNSALNIPLVTGDYLEIKGVQPLWATNPATCIYGGYLYFE